MNGFIEIVTGTLGGGKTTLAIERAYDHLCKGGWVYTNVECYPDKIAALMASRDFKVFDPERLVMLKGDAREFHKFVKRGTADCLVMLVIDEAGLELNARDWAKTEKTQLAFNTMARKLDIWLVYISQNANDVDKQIRSKADTVWVCRNMKKCKIWGVIPTPLPFYFRVRFDTTRGKWHKGESEVVLKSHAWGLFNSDAMVGMVGEQFNAMESVRGAPLPSVGRPDDSDLFGVRIPRHLLAFITCASFYLFS